MVRGPEETDTGMETDIEGGTARMRSALEQERYVVAIGEAAQVLLTDRTATVLARLDGVVLVRVDRGLAERLRSLAVGTVHVFANEAAARRAFGLFEH
jgi:hypothetical protein